MRIAHLSDLHFGRHDQKLADGLANEIDACHPDVVVISGDFAQVGTAEEFAAAGRFVKQLKAPVLAVPGNHDVPARNLFLRFAAPYALYRRYIALNLEPFLELDGVAIAGLRTSRRMRFGLNWAHGSISRGQLDALAARFDKASPKAVRIVVAHHPLFLPEGEEAASRRRVRHADLALETFARLGVRLVLSGHFHLSYIRRYEQAGAAGAVKKGEPSGPRTSAVAPIIVCQASSTISTRLRGEPNAYNLIDITDGAIEIAVREWLPGAVGWTTREKTAAPAKPETSAVAAA